jgi:hypothetical protein
MLLCSHARASSCNPDFALQVQPLRTVGCDVVRTEKTSGPAPVVVEAAQTGVVSHLSVSKGNIMSERTWIVSYKGKKDEVSKVNIRWQGSLQWKMLQFEYGDIF